jgi:hypothetical protein
LKIVAHHFTEGEWRLVFSIGKRTVIALAFMGAVVCIVNGMLILQNRNLKLDLKSKERDALVRIGQKVPPLKGRTAQGDAVALEYGDDARDTLILVYSPHCGFCTENLPNWKAIAKSVDHSLFRVAAVSIVAEGAAEYLSANGLTVNPTITEVDPKTRAAYEMNVTPMTILVGPDGRVKDVWSGVLGADDRQQIRDSVGVQLPPTR